MLETVQKRATKILSQHRHLSYTDRLKVYKLRLDKFWQNQDIVYNFRAEIEGTRNRSEV